MARRQRRATRGLAGISMSALATEMRRRERMVRTLERKRERLMGRVAQLDRQIAGMGAMSGGRGARAGDGGVRRRPRNASNLVDALAKVLNGKTMSVTEVAEAVQRAGYKTSSANFRTIVNQALIKSERFKKVGRGQYTAK